MPYSHEQKTGGRARPSRVDLENIKCGGKGHMRADCPSGARQVNTLSDDTDGGPRMLRPGSLFSQPVDDILVDLGATYSMISEDLVPPGTYPDSWISIQTVSGERKQYRTVMVPVTRAGRDMEVRLRQIDWDAPLS